MIVGERRRVWLCCLNSTLFLVLFSIALRNTAQTTVGTGGIVGTVGDPSGAVINGASVTITNIATGQLISLTTNAFGMFTLSMEWGWRADNVAKGIPRYPEDRHIPFCSTIFRLRSFRISAGDRSSR